MSGTVRAAYLRGRAAPTVDRGGDHGNARRPRGRRHDLDRPVRGQLPADAGQGVPHPRPRVLQPGQPAARQRGNAVHSVYVFSLPLGPIWFLHAFYVLATALMLLWHFRYVGRSRGSSRAPAPTTADGHCHLSCGQVNVVRVAYESEFPPFYVTVDIVVLAIRGGRLHALMIRRGGEPYAGAWALPGGFVGIDEDLRDAAERELEEETGVRIGTETLTQVRTYGAPDRDPRHRVVSVAWLSAFPETVEVTAGTDAAHAEWRPVDELLTTPRPTGWPSTTTRSCVTPWRPRGSGCSTPSRRCSRPASRAAGVQPQPAARGLRGGARPRARPRQLPAQGQGHPAPRRADRPARARARRSGPAGRDVPAQVTRLRSCRRSRWAARW